MSMIVNVHTTSRFWLLELARQLHLRGQLGMYTTTDPAFLARRAGLPSARIRSFGRYRLCELALSKLRLSGLLPADWLGSVFAAKSAAGVTNCDILVHLSYKSLAALDVCRKKGIVSVVSHGNTHVRTQERWIEEAYGAAGLRCQRYNPDGFEKDALTEYDMADFIEVPTKVCMGSFADQGVAPEKLLLNPFPVDTDYWRPEQKPDARTELRFLFAGSIQVRKGVATLLEAWKRAKPERAGLYFSVSAIWNDMPQTLARYEGLFTVLKPMANQALFRKRINGYHVLVLPSFEEGFSFALAQGMACGLAPLCSDRSGGQELLADGTDGLIVKAGDVDGLVSAIRRLCDDRDLWRHLGNNARKVCLEQLTPWHYGERAVANYSRILESRSVAMRA